MSDPTDRVRDAISMALEQAVPEADPLAWDAPLTGQGGLDSVQVMNLVMEIEDALDLSVPVDALSEVTTLQQLADQLLRLLEAKQA